MRVIITINNIYHNENSYCNRNKKVKKENELTTLSEDYEN